MKDLIQTPNTNLFSIKPRIAITVGFLLLALIFFLDFITPNEYRFVTLYIFPAAVIALNTKSLQVVIGVVCLAVALENYTTFVDHNFQFSFSLVDVVNFFIRLSATVLIVWLARALRRSQLRINLMAHSDSLTGLWNRRWARISIEQAMARMKEDKSYFSVALIDLNDFKKVNDEMGHLVGDDVLVKVSQIFMSLTTPEVTFFRLGGDEFIALMNQKDEQEAKIICNTMMEKVREAMAQGNYPTSLSIGLITYYKKPQSVSQVLQEADSKMYQNKSVIKST